MPDLQGWPSSVLVVGAGKMGSAMVDGWMAYGYPGAAISLLDPAATAAEAGWRTKKVTVYPSIEAVPGDARPEVVLLAVKPQIMADVLPGLARLDHDNLTVVSVAAGIQHKTLTDAFPQSTCVRTIPNTPAAVGKGATGAFADELDPVHRARVDALLGAIGTVVWVEDESLIDAVTALSGSGPAFVFHLVEAMSDAGVELGLEAASARDLARQTLIGAAALLETTGEDAARLRENVTSPGGTTAAGLAVLRDSGALTDLMTSTLRAAMTRSRELAGPSDNGDKS